jgi:hypothetical protein
MPIPLLGKKTKYEVRQDGEWYLLPSVNACCDCGLVHRHEYKIVELVTVSGLPSPKMIDSVRLETRAFRDNRRTSAIRRGRREAMKKRLNLK